MKRYNILFVMAAVILLVAAAVLATGGALANEPAVPQSPEAPLMEPDAPQARVILQPTALTWVSDAQPATSFGGQGYA